jgi:hypothetical protein
MDPLDERLRKAMKALDDQVSDRYFDELPTRTLARLEEQMQSDVNRRSGSANPPLNATPERQEDSGLHDMRALAQSTKQRMSARKIPTQNPPMDDDAALRASSASLRAIALPDPDKMVALDETPTMGNGTGPAPLLDRARSEPGVATAAARPSPITPMKRKSKAPLIVASSVAIAAAAGVVGFVVLKKNAATTDTAPAAATAPALERGMAEQQKMTVEPTAPAPTPPMALESTNAAAPGGAAAGAATMAADGLAADDEAAKADDPKDAKGGKEKDRADDRQKKDDKDKDKDKTEVKTTPDKGGDKPVPVTTPVTPPKEGPADKQEQSLDDLLRSAGEDPNAKKKDDGPKLDKKALDATDILKAMSALNSKAQGCHAKYGVSGNVAVKLQVAPSGDVKSAKVTGSFAGTPTGDCVQSVVNGAKFPPWDGGQTTVNYSYFLSE